MSGASNDRAERRGRILAELAELGMGLARRVHERAMAAEDAHDADRLTLAFHRLSRSVRQTLALEARLEREDQRAAVEDERRAEDHRRGRVQARRDQVDATVRRLIWTEAERRERGELQAGLDKILAEACAAETFLEGPVEALIARIREDLGLAANDAGLPPPGQGADPPDRWNSG